MSLYDRSTDVRNSLVTNIFGTMFAIKIFPVKKLEFLSLKIKRKKKIHLFLITRKLRRLLGLIAQIWNGNWNSSF